MKAPVELPDRPAPPTFGERVEAIKAFRFTERQARFLVTVMLHSGVCLGRQYCAFAGIEYGAPVANLFKTLQARRFATPQVCGHNRARLFHLHYKPLYAAIGEPDNRFRRPMTLARAVERLMLLDAVMADRSLIWLGTERDKLHYFRGIGVPYHDLPALTFRSVDEETVRFFPEKQPIGVANDGRTHVFLYLVTRSTPMDFRLFLEHHAELLRSLPAWTIRLLVPRHLRDAAALHREAFAEHLTRPLPAEVVDEMRWYFRACRDAGVDPDERYYRAQTAFAGPRFRALYRQWLMDGERVLDAVMSPVLADLVDRRVGVLDCQVLPHPYLHLLPLVGTA
ncbi:MAG: hypothetical protein ACRD2X_20795 [Vicinamibacteraceae bacterium]